MTSKFINVMTPQQIVGELDKHIVGQMAAKRAVAIALRNRFRRMQIAMPLRQEITPKNILMIGPTGVGKTEIARRLAKLANAPFIKVEATKFTEVGYVGRDVDSIVRDLVDISVKQTREEAVHKVKGRADALAKERILTALLPKTAPTASQSPADIFASVGAGMGNLGQMSPSRTVHSEISLDSLDEQEKKESDSSLRKMYLQKLDAGELDEREIEIEISQSAIGVEIMAPPGMEEMTSQLQNMFQSMSGERTKRRKMKVKDAFRILREEEASKLINEDEIKSKALERAEQSGIVFIDEIDKITQRSEFKGSADVSREGVQRDLLPLVEGCTVSTKYGMVKTDHVLFIASGAFHLSKPSDLIPELQGRLPIRVELDPLKTEEFVRILTEPDACLTVQYQALMNTESVTLTFEESGIRRIAEMAFEINERTENIGARRLHTVMERLLDELSFGATEMSGQTVVIDEKYVNQQLNNLIKDEDLSRFIL